MNGIRKETGRATFDEILRLRLRLDILESENNSFTQSVASTAGQIIGTKGAFLRLDTTNDPLTGDLEIQGKVTITRTGHISAATSGDTVLTLDGKAGGTSMQPDDASVSANLQWWWKASDESARADGSSVTSFALNAASQAATTTLTKVGGTTLYRKTSGENSTAWFESTAQCRFLADNDVAATGGYTIISVYRTGDADNASTNPMFGASGAGSKKGVYFVGTTNSNDWAQYSFFDEGDQDWLEASNEIEGGDPPVQTWFIGVWRRNGSDEMEILHAAVGTALADITIATPLVRGEDLDLDLMWGDIGGGTTQANVGVGVAEFMIYDKTLSADEMTQIYAYLADKFGFALSSAPGDILDMQADAVTKSVFDGEGKLHIGGSDPQFDLDVEGDADISGIVTAVGVNISDKLTVTGKTEVNTISTTAITMIDNARISFGTGPDSFITWDGSQMVINTTVEEPILIKGDGITLGNTTSDVTNKICRINTLPYTFTGRDLVSIFQITNTNGASTLNIGGGSTVEDAATGIEFWTTTSVGTLKGIDQWIILNNGNFRNEQANIFDMQGGDVTLDDNGFVAFGTALDSRIFYDGTNTQWNLQVVGTGNLLLNDGDVVLNTGDVVATAGDLIATAGNVVATAGDVIATAGDVDIVAGVLKGDRREFQAGISSMTGDGFLHIGGGGVMSSTFGFIAQRAGSILASSFSMSTISIVTDANIQYQVRVNNSSVHNITQFSTVTTAIKTQARGLDTFSAGDLITFHIDFNVAFDGDVQISMQADIIYDD